VATNQASATGRAHDGEVRQPKDRRIRHTTVPRNQPEAVFPFKAHFRHESWFPRRRYVHDQRCVAAAL